MSVEDEIQAAWDAMRADRKAEVNRALFDVSAPLAVPPGPASVILDRETYTALLQRSGSKEPDSMATQLFDALPEAFIGEGPRFLPLFFIGKGES